MTGDNIPDRVSLPKLKFDTAKKLVFRDCNKVAHLLNNIRPDLEPKPARRMRMIPCAKPTLNRA